MTDAPAPTSANAPAQVSEDDLYDALRLPRRRTALSIIADSSGAVPVRELGRLVAARERDDDPEAVAVDDADEVRVLLHHADLPKLDDADIVEYDRTDRVVHPAVDLASLPGVAE